MCHRKGGGLQESDGEYEQVEKKEWYTLLDIKKRVGGKMGGYKNEITNI